MDTEKAKMKHAIDELIKVLEVDMFNWSPAHERGLRKTLGKLGIKSVTWIKPLLFEGLEATLRDVTFDAKHLSQWKTDGGK